MATDKQIRGYLKCAADRSTFGLPTFNDAYNVATYGIDRATWYSISRAISDKIGFAGDKPRTVAAVRACLARAASAIRWQP